MGVYNYILTTKFQNVLTVEGGEKVKVYGVKYLSKQSYRDGDKPWQTALMARIDKLFTERGLPQYVAYHELNDGTPVYEGCECTSFTDDYLSTTIHAGYIRGAGRTKRFERWHRLGVKIPSDANHPANTIGKASIHIRQMLEDSGMLFGGPASAEVRTHLGKNKMVIVTARDLNDILMAKMVLSGSYEFETI